MSSQAFTAAGNPVTMPRRLSKRQRCAAVLERVGGIRLLERLPRRDCLIVLNYHRIGWADQAVYDPCVYSCSPEAFVEQVKYLTQNFEVITLEQAVEFAVNGVSATRTAKILITFDDGYRDNYEYAFPILRQHGAQGTFFLCTSLVGSSTLPWWDQIAFLLRQTKRERIRLQYPEEIELDLRESGFLDVLRVLLRMYKDRTSMDKDRFLKGLSEAVDVTAVTSTERLFLDWEEAREMVRGGMAIGSHTHSHSLLSHLTAEQQVEEVTQSRQTLEKHLGIPIDTLAYPVGEPASFSADTFRALEQAGYRAAFSYYGGINTRQASNPYNLLRMSVDDDVIAPLFRLRVASAAVVSRPLL
jgi:peptidoglycan/xylan/chitin deacetylase (PgdA/CDA1 family)